MGCAEKIGVSEASPRRQKIGAEVWYISPEAAVLTIIFCSEFFFLKALAAEIEKNQAKLDQCQKFSQQYSAAVKVRALPKPRAQFAPRLLFTSWLAER